MTTLLKTLLFKENRQYAPTVAFFWFYVLFLIWSAADYWAVTHFVDVDTGFAIMSVIVYIPLMLLFYKLFLYFDLIECRGWICIDTISFTGEVLGLTLMLPLIFTANYLVLYFRLRFSK